MARELRESGLKLTPQRLAIVRELAEDLSHPTAHGLFERLRGELPSMSFATVYNTLDALARLGLCSARALTPGATRFDPNTGPHHHAVCDRCGAVADLPARPARSVAEAPPGFSVRAVEQIVRGVCASCELAARGKAAPRRARASSRKPADRRSDTKPSNRRLEPKISNKE